MRPSMRLLPVKLLVLASLALLPACAAPDSGLPTPADLSGEAGWSSWTDDLEPSAGTDLPDGDVEPVAHTDTSRRWSCEDRPYTCAEDYLAYPARAAEFARPVTDCAALRWDLERMAVGEIPMPRWMGPLDAEALQAHMIDGASIAHLLTGLSQRPLDVTTIDDRVLPVLDGVPDSPTYRQIELLFEDPWVAEINEIQALLLLPEGEGPFPAVVAMPGHFELAADFRDMHYGKYFPMHGYALLIITPRGYGDEPTEDRYTEDLLCAGFTSVGLRMYEALLGLRYLGWNEATAGQPLAVIGHSGGSATVNALARIGAPIQAVVTDLTSQYLSFSGNYGEGGEYYTYGRWYVDETAPGVSLFAGHINAFSTARMPVLQLPYGYGDPELDTKFPPEPDPDDAERYGLIFDFLDGAMRPSPE